MSQTLRATEGESVPGGSGTGSNRFNNLFTRPKNAQAAALAERRNKRTIEEQQDASPRLSNRSGKESIGSGVWSGAGGADASKPDWSPDVCDLFASLEKKVTERFSETNDKIDRLSNQLNAGVTLMLELTQAWPRSTVSPLGVRSARDEKHFPRSALFANGRSDVEITSKGGGKLKMTLKEAGLDDFGPMRMASLKPELTDDSSPPMTSRENIDAHFQEGVSENIASEETRTNIAADEYGTPLEQHSNASPTDTPENRESVMRVNASTTTSISSDLLNHLGKVLNRVRSRSTLSRKLWLYLEEPDLVYGGRTFLHLLTLWSLGACLVTILQTIEDPPLRASTAAWFEVSWDATSSLELLVRFVVCPNRIAFFFSTFNWIDLVAGPLPLILRAVLALYSLQGKSNPYTDVYIFLTCFVPALRLLRMIRHFESLHLLLKAFQQAGEVIPFLLFTLAIKVVVFSSIIYMVEPRSNIDSLPSAIWFTIVTVGTVGYGDMVPASPAGTIIVMGLIVISAMYMAMPIGLIGRAFGDVWENRDLLLLAQRARRRFLSNGFKPEDVPAMFMSFDLDGNGQLSLREFCSMMDSLQIDISGGRVVRLFQSFDADGGGTIDDAEFVRLLFPAAYAEIYGKHLMDDEDLKPMPPTNSGFDDQTPAP